MAGTTRRSWLLAALLLVSAPVLADEGRQGPDRIGVLPDIGEIDAVVTPRGELIHHDFRTGRTTRLPASDWPDLPPGAFTTAPVRGRYGSEPGAAGDKNFNGWSMVADPTFGTYPRHVKLRLFSVTALGDTLGGQCSGTLISPLHVLTAGHCVYYHVENGLPAFEYADRVTVTPGYESGSGPWGDAEAASLLSWSGWVDDEDRDHDVALITLDRPLGALAGWQGYGYDTEANFWYGSGWTITGYPAESPYDGQTQWTTSGSFDVYYGNQIQFDQPSWGGASGSGAVNGGAAYGVLTASDRETNTIVTRLTPAKFGDIQARIATDQPDTPDLWPLQVLTSASGDTVAAGATLGSFFFRIHNFSAAPWSGPIPYQIMLSTNDVIAGTDIEIHSGTLNLSIAANGTANVNVPAVQIDPDVPEGDYFVGVRLNVSDADPLNDDTGPRDLDFLRVDCPSPPAPWMGIPADDATCVPTTGAQLAWGNVASAVVYQLIWGKVGDTANVVNGLTGTTYTLPQLQPDQQYFWQARAGNACGVYNTDSPSFLFTTRDEPAVPTVVFPPDGDTCQPAFQVVIDWEDVPDAAAYQVRWATTCGWPTTPATNTQSAYAILGLADDETYFYQVRTQGPCGNWGAWSDCRSFTTRPSVLGVPQQFFPPAGYGCVGSPAAVSWEAIAGADSYEVVWGATCAGADTLVVATNAAQLPVSGPGEVVWKVRASRCGFPGDFSACHTFTVDTAAPDTAANFASTSHAPGVWSAQPAVDLKWDDVVDPGGCGLVFCELAWHDDVVPPPLPWNASTPTQPYTTPPLPDGAGNYIHLWVRDGAGNFAPASQVLGPFAIDTTGPEAPDVTTVPPVGGYTGQTTITADWTTPDDAGVGFAGFRHGLYADPHGTPSGGLSGDLSAQWSGLSDGQYWFRLAAFDSLGNAGDTLGFGPLGVDTTPPVPEITLPEPGETVVHLQAVDVFYDARDVGSGTTWLEFAYSPDDVNWFAIAAGPPAAIGDPLRWDVPYPTTPTMRLRLRATDAVGNVAVWVQPEPLRVTSTVGVAEGDVPSRVGIAGVYPNPFNPRTTIRYGLPRAGDVRLTVHDATGRLVRTLAADRAGAGWREAVWNGLDDGGRRVASGVYFARLVAGGETAVRPMTLVK
ncbi:trypsin-like serine protease [bacterium]|nr:trypsin-like serine protease [bacterium]